MQLFVLLQVAIGRCVCGISIRFRIIGSHLARVRVCNSDVVFHGIDGERDYMVENLGSLVEQPSETDFDSLEKDCKTQTITLEKLRENCNF